MSVDANEVAFFRYFSVTKPIYLVDKIVQRLILQCATGKDVRHSLATDPKLVPSIELGERNCLVPFSSVLFVHLMVRGNYCSAPLTQGLPWSAQPLLC